MSNSPTGLHHAAVPTPRVTELLRGRLYAGLQWMRGRPLTRFVRQLREWEQLQPSEFDKLHEQRLQWILGYAIAHVPLYRTGPWQSASSARDFNLEAWPVIEKDVLRTQFEQLLAEPQPRRIVTQRTSGSTGTPVRVAMTVHADTWGWAHRYRHLNWHGVPIGVRSLRLSHDRRPLRDRILGQICVQSMESRQSIEEALQFLVDDRPTLVAGSPSALFHFARHLRERGVTEPLAPLARVGGEEMFAFQKTEIESFLSARTINSYGCTETGALAGECPAGSLHVFADHVHLEIFHGDSPARNGELGDIVVTSLRNTAMPLIRYRVGDRGRLSPDRCKCGLPHPVLTDLQARLEDRFSAINGSVHHGSELAEGLGSLFADPVSEGVRQVQFGQIDPSNWEVWVDASDALRAAEYETLTRKTIDDRLAGIVRETFGSECRVKTHMVDAIPRKRGKFRYYRAGDQSGRFSILSADGDLRRS